jgi:hypothetical protein
LPDEISKEKAAEEKPTLFNQLEGVDWLLAWIINLVEHGLEIGITLSVRGQLVSGTVVGGRKYFEILGKSFETANFGGGLAATDLKETLGAAFSQWKDIYPKSEDIPSNDVARPAFIHLENAKIWLDNNQLNSNGMLWRGQLSAVDGFTLGTMSPTRS